MSKILKTKVTEMLGIEYPIFQGCMQWIAKAELVAAVSEAGGMGILSSSTFSNKDDLRAEIKKIKALTSKPFAVNLTFFPSLTVQDHEGYINVCIEEGVTLMETAGRMPGDDVIKQIKEGGLIWMHKCTTLKHALKAQSMGCDLVVADGFECAGHPGEKDIGTMVLTALCVEKMHVPIVSAGGIGTGKQMAAALMLGADAVYMGTRFLLSKESPVMDSVKDFLAEKATEVDTALVMRPFVNSMRVYNSALVKDINAREKAGCKFDAIRDDVSGAHACKLFFETGDLDKDGVISYGQVGGLLDKVLPVKEIVDSMMADCEKALCRFDA
ncbi:MAG: nitronate monooxygenase [Oscillospiraceae bacterium]|nr:nitronate monooxygenase [Oscillospiraceae bacterium]